MAQKYPYNAAAWRAGIAQLVEHNLAKVRVASSSLVFRSQEKATQVVFSFFMHFSCRKFFVYLLRVL